MEGAAGEVALPIAEAFIVAAQKPVAICLLVNRALPKDRIEAAHSALVEVRAFGIIILATPRIVGAGAQAVLVTLIVGV
jgi:hypothetical protein